MQRRPRLVALVAAVVLLTALPVSQQAAAIDPLPDSAPEVGDSVIASYWSEPEFLLTAGAERWNVRNSPDGTVVAAYDKPEGAIDDGYMATGRFAPQQPLTGGGVLDVSVLHAAYERSQSWAFIRKDDGTAEVVGPMEQGWPRRYLLQISGEAIVGGTVSADEGTAGSEVPIAAVVTDAGRLLEFRGDAQTGTTYRAEVVTSAVGSPVAAVGRMFTGFERSDELQASSGFAEGDGSHGESADVLTVLLDSGDVVPLRRSGSALDSWIEMDELAVELTDDEKTVLAGVAHPILDFDVLCAVDVTNEQGSTTGRVGPVSAALGCRQATVDGLQQPSMGRFVVAAGVDAPSDRFGSAYGSVWAHQVVDLRERVNNTVTIVKRVRQPTEACTFLDAPDDSLRPGAFDIRTTAAQTVVGCVSEDSFSADRIETTTFRSPAVPTNSYFTPSTDPQPINEDSWDTVNTAIERTTVDALAGEDVTVETRTYTDITAPTVQLQFPCNRLLARPIGGQREFAECRRDESFAPSDGLLDLADPIPGMAPDHRVALTVAGYGNVEGEPGVFVSLVRPGDAESGDPTADQGLLGEDLLWTVEPARLLADDLERIRSTPSEVDLDALDRFEVGDPATAPPALLTEIPRPGRTPITIRIQSEPDLETAAGLPIAVLQAPPTVAGLGQQATFTPEFASTEGSSSATAQSRSSRIGAHVGFEVTATAGVGFLGNNARAGGGVAVGYEFMNEVEQSIENIVEFEKTESYGGSFADHTVVTTSRSEYVYQAIVEEDATGLATGSSFEYRIPAGVVNQSRPLSDLEATDPRLYGPDGLYRPMLDRLVGNVVIGNPGSYPSGEGSSEPTTVLADNGGVCLGGYAAADDPTPTPGELPDLAPVENPYYSSPPPNPVGPSILTSEPHVVSLGNDLTEGASIALTSATASSLVTSKSHDFMIEGIAKVESEVSSGGSAKIEAEFRAGIDGGFSLGNGVSDTLSTGSELSAVMGNIPFSTDGRPWLEDEAYSWRMYMCKARLGPGIGGAEVWVQGYVVDGYAGSGGIDELAPVAGSAPAEGDVVAAEPSSAFSLDATVATDCAVDDTFRWRQDAGTVARYVLEVENAVTGQRQRATLADAADPVTADSRGPVDCASVLPDSYVEGDLHRWRVRSEGFVDDVEVSEWESFRPQAVPSEHTISLLQPLVLEDGSIRVDIDDPTGVRSFVHDVVIYDADDVSPSGIVASAQDVGSTHRMASLLPGRYVVEAVGHNDHVDEIGQTITTPPVRAELTVDDQLAAQFRTSGCALDPDCSIADTITFEDLSAPGGDVPLTDWFWTFGDGTTSAEQHPTHRFAEPGDYDVTLYVRDAAGRADQITELVTVGLPSADLAMAADGGGEVPLGGTASFRLTVTNGGPEPSLASTAQPLTVEVDVPPGLDPVSASGSGWSCTVAPEVRCTRDATLAVGGSAPDVTVRADVTDAGAGEDEVGATVSSGRSVDPIAGNDVATAPYRITFTREAELVPTTLPSPIDETMSMTVLGDEVCVALDTTDLPGTVSSVELTDGAGVSVVFPAGSADVSPEGLLQMCGPASEDVRDTLSRAPETIDVLVYVDGDPAAFLVGTAQVPAPPSLPPAPVPPPPSGPSDPDAPEDPSSDTETLDVDDADPLDGAITISKRRFGDDDAGHVVLARDDTFADSLTGSVLTSTGPLLYTGRDALDPRTEAEIRRVLPGGGRVLVLGGDAALSDAVVDRLGAVGYRADRLAGPTRVETALAIADEALRLAAARGERPPEVLLSRWDGWADAVTAGAHAAASGSPVLLTGNGGLHPAVADWLDGHTDLDPVAIGGTAALSSITVAAAGADRIGGGDRFETAALIAERWWPATPPLAFVANGIDPGAWRIVLAAAGYAADEGAPILLVTSSVVTDATDAVLCASGTRLRSAVLGSTSLVGPGVRATLEGSC
ncbi:cell wall-binding repeat-containing protein [Acidimicrobiia bacterium EGI L10123]|uniref:cell wall-binding repeat-containing protein n=1 Tax=Salinilacustrithrix flava TaxID=2957203 RepID=UPI003D7C16E9|nr:cell wall-binding repeat-containing protein [Acidimicrobiia bacterium EGI L10123]